MLDDRVDQHALESREKVADLRRDDVFNRRVINHAFERLGKVFNDDNGFGTGILELVFKFASRVKRIDVDNDKAGTQNSKDGDDVLQEVRHHDGDAVTTLHVG